MSARRVVIVGGGISGLSIAEAVTRKSEAAGVPAEVTVLEAAAEAGGKIRSSTQDGFVIETGPHGFLDKEPAMFSLIDRMGIGQDLLRANEASAKRYVVRQGKLRMVPMSPTAGITSDILPLMAKLRLGFEPFAAKRPDREESVWEFASRRIGKTAADVLVDAMVTGIYGGDPKALSLKSAFPRMYELESLYGGLVKAQFALAKQKKALAAVSGQKPEPSGSAPGQPTGTLYSFNQGLGRLTTALAERTQIRCNYRVEALETDGATYTVRGSGDPIEADAVVLTGPAYGSAQLLGPHVSEIAHHFEGVPYADISVVVQGFRATDLQDSADGFGFLAAHGEGRRILGSIFASTVFPPHVPEGMVMFRTLIGGARNAALASAGDAQLFTIAKSELSQLGCVPDAAKPVLQKIVRWPKGIPQYTMGHAERVAAADGLETSLPGVFAAGNGFRGVAMLACVGEAQKVADRVMSHLGRLQPGA